MVDVSCFYVRISIIVLFMMHAAVRIFEAFESCVLRPHGSVKAIFDYGCARPFNPRAH